MYLGKVTKTLVPIFLNGYVVCLNGMTGSEYGKLVAWEDHPHAFDWMTTRKQFLPGEALDILEVQDRLIRFLVDCCEQLLRDISPAELLSDKYPVQPEPSLKSGVEPDGLESLAVMAEEAPSGRPAVLILGASSPCLQRAPRRPRIGMWFPLFASFGFTDDRSQPLGLSRGSQLRLGPAADLQGAPPGDDEGHERQAPSSPASDQNGHFLGAGHRQRPAQLAHR
jgi:hypothetical protein